MGKLAPLLGLVAALAACGPVESAVVLGDAEVALAGARAAEAEELAPYEYTSAELYLEKAFEERGRADFDAARAYAQKSEQFALEARTQALRAAREGVPARAPIEPDPGARPGPEEPSTAP